MLITMRLFWLEARFAFCDLDCIKHRHNNSTEPIIQLTEGGVITEPGQNVLLNVEQEHKPEPGLVQTQPQLMEVQVVMGRRLKLKTVTITSAQVNKTKT